MEPTVKIYTYSELMAKKIPPIQYLVEGIIPEASVVFVFGPQGSFKTNFLIHTSICGADGQKVLNFNVRRPFKTLFIDEENREPGMHDKITKIANGITLKDPKSIEQNIISTEQNFKLTPDGIAWLEALIKKHDPDLVIIDSIAKVFTLKENDESDVRLIYPLISPLIIKYGVTIIFIHHPRKRNYQQSGRDMDDMAGSREFSAMADSVLLIEEWKKNNYILKQVKSRYGEKQEAVNFTVEGDADKIIIKFIGKVSDNI
jgi:RecA-family ATPase